MPGSTESEITAFVVARIAILRHRDPDTVDIDRAFNELGVDSLDAVSLVGDIEERFAVVIDPVELFDHPTPSALAIMIATRISSHAS